MFQNVPLERFNPPNSKQNPPVVWKSASQNIPRDIPFVWWYDNNYAKTKCIIYSCYIYPKYLKALNKKKSSFQETHRKSSVQSHEGRVLPNESLQRRDVFDPCQLCQRNSRDNWPQRTPGETTCLIWLPFLRFYFFWQLYNSGDFWVPFIFADWELGESCVCTVGRRKICLFREKTSPSKK